MQRMPSSRRSVRLISVACALLCAACSSQTSLRTPTSQAEWIDAILRVEDARDATDALPWTAIQQADPLVRLFGFRALGRIGARDTLPQLFSRVVVEEDPRVREEALFALASLRDARFVDAAEAFVLDADPALREVLARGLGACGDDRAIIPLIDLTGDPDPAVRGSAALALAQLLSGRDDPLAGRPVGAFQPLVDRLRRDPSPEVRWRVAYTLGVMGRREWIPALVAAARDDASLVRVMACEGLRKVTVESAPAEMIEALSARLGDAEWTVAVEAARALGEHPGPSAVSSLLAGLGRGAGGGHRSFHVRAACASALAAYGDREEVVPALSAALADVRESVRIAALESIVRIAVPEQALRDIERVLADDPSDHTKSRVAVAAVELKQEGGYRVVHDLLDDPSPGVRAAALGVLGKFPARTAAAVEPVRAALGERDVALLDGAAQAVMALGLNELIPDVRKALEDADGADFIEARVQLIHALADRAGEDAIEDLRRCLVDPESAVRSAARDEIARLGGAIPKLPRLAPAAPATEIDASIDVLRDEYPRVELITDRGVVELEVLSDQAPMHAAAFLERCRGGFYDGLGFHRLVPGFVVQGLDPRGDGYGTGGVSLRAEVNRRRYERGSVGMPDAGFDTGGCQIFITFRPQPRLDARYTLFARVVSGMDVVEELDVGDRVERVVVIDDL